MRLHICWGNYEGPHTHDLPLQQDHRYLLQGAPAGAAASKAPTRVTSTNGRT